MNRRQSWASLYWREDCCVILWKQGSESGSPWRRQSRTRAGHRLGQSDDCCVFVAGSLCGLWKSSSCLEWLSACSPTSLTSDWLLEGVFRSWTTSYLRHSSVKRSTSDLQSGPVRALREVMLCSLVLGKLVSVAAGFLELPQKTRIRDKAKTLCCRVWGVCIESW